MRSTTRRRPAGGFTLVELIVVITIILILVGLTLSAVTKARDAAVRAQTKAEIGEMGLGVESLKSTFEVKYVPTYLILANDYSSPDPAYQDSRRYLTRLWPKMNPAVAFPTIDPKNPIVLDGNQVLVFLLGGVPPGGDPSPGTYRFPSNWMGNRSGFLNSPNNPMNMSGGNATGPADGSVAKGPFFNFKLDRLDEFAHYHDPYWDKQTKAASIYYYFSSKNGNDYNAFNIYNSVDANVTAQGGYGGMDPFKGPDNKFIRPDSFQIVSCGKDRQNGPGGAGFNPGTGSYTPGAPGGDDLANFHEGMLASD